MIPYSVRFLPFRPGRAGALARALVLFVALGAGSEALAQGEDAGEGKGPPPAGVRVGHVKRQALRERFSVVGELRAIRRAEVPAEQAGRLIEVPVEAGDPVEAGEVLARVEPVWAELDLADARAAKLLAEAELAEAEADVELARIDRGYLEELAARDSAQPREVREARTELEASEARREAAAARLAAAEAELDRARTRVAKLEVVAPFAGAVVRRIQELGAWTEAGAPVFEVVSRGRIDAWLDVPQGLVDRVQVGRALGLRIDATGEHLEAPVHAIMPAGDRRARTFPVRIRLEDREGRLKPGMSVRAAVPLGDKKPQLTVPRDGLLREPGHGVVWVVSEGRAEPVRVEVLFREGDRFAIRAEGRLEAGTPVVIEGAEGLRPGQAVRIVGEEAAAP